MLFLSTSLESLLSEHVSGQLLLTIFLLLLISCFSVNSYRIDSSCQNYKGVNITGDIKQAINEVQQMASYAFDRDHSRSANTVCTLRVLFGDNLSSHAAVTGFFQNLSNAVHTQEFTVICGDEMVKLAGDLHGPLGLWVDRVHNWHMKYHIYNPCDPARKLNGPDIMVDAFTISAQLIYLCPRILDHPKGRSLATYRDRVVTGESINDYFIVPAILFHELLHTSIAFLTDVMVQGLPTPSDYRNPHIDVYDPEYVKKLPMVNACGFMLCYKLACENPSLSVRNADSVAFCALILYLRKNVWTTEDQFGLAVPLG